MSVSQTWTSTLQKASISSVSLKSFSVVLMNVHSLMIWSHEICGLHSSTYLTRCICFPNYKTFTVFVSAQFCSRSLLRISSLVCPSYYQHSYMQPHSERGQSVHGGRFYSLHHVLILTKYNTLLLSSNF